MLISVIIATCNRNDFLIKCLDLIAPATQTIDAECYEVIVTDDSKDNIAKNLVKEKYIWARWTEGPKKGPAANRNNGAKYAVGQWLVFLDDDCLPSKNILENYATSIKLNKDIEVFEGKIAYEGKRKTPLDTAPSNSKTRGALWSCNFCISKVLFYQLNGFDENFIYAHMEDNDLKIRIDAVGKEILFAEDAAVVHPWRKIVNGKQYGKNEEMTIYYNAKHGIENSLLQRLKIIAGKYWRIVLLSIFYGTFFTAIKIAVQHAAILIFNFNKWKKKYSVNTISNVNSSSNVSNVVTNK